MFHLRSRTAAILIAGAVLVAAGLIVLETTSPSSAAGAGKRTAADASSSWGSPSRHAGEGTGSSRSAEITVSTHSSPLGTILVNSAGRTLYGFTRDRREHDSCLAVSGCTSAWPIAVASGRIRAGHGVPASLLGSLTLPNGVRQITYDGRPLYTYAFDSGAAQTGYVGADSFGGVWKAVRPSGSLVG